MSEEIKVRCHECKFTDIKDKFTYVGEFMDRRIYACPVCKQSATRVGEMP